MCLLWFPDDSPPPPRCRSITKLCVAHKCLYETQEIGLMSHIHLLAFTFKAAKETNAVLLWTFVLGSQQQTCSSLHAVTQLKILSSWGFSILQDFCLSLESRAANLSWIQLEIRLCFALRPFINTVVTETGGVSYCVEPKSSCQTED